MVVYVTNYVTHYVSLVTRVSVCVLCESSVSVPSPAPVMREHGPPARTTGIA